MSYQHLREIRESELRGDEMMRILGPLFTSHEIEFPNDCLWFLEAYELGQETYAVEREIAELDRRVESIQQRLVSDKLEDGVRRELRRQLAELYNRGNWLRRSHDRLEREWWRRAESTP